MIRADLKRILIFWRKIFNYFDSKNTYAENWDL